MKLYRFVKLDLNNLKENQRYFYEGRENEGRNLVNYRLLSPSNGYLNHFDFNDKGPNTFGREKEMTKYFFANLYDCLKYAEHYIKLYYFKYGVKYEPVIMEIDLPEKIVLPYIGMGNYFGQYVVEFRIPYQLLASVFNHNIYPLQDALAFFNEHMGEYETVWLQIMRTEEYQAFLESLPKANFAVSMESKVTIYPYLCFPFPADGEILRASTSCNNYYNWIEGVGNYIWDHFYQTYSSNHKQITKFYANGLITDYGKLGAYTETVVAKENRKLKRILKHGGYKFQ